MRWAIELIAAAFVVYLGDFFFGAAFATGEANRTTPAWFYWFIIGCLATIAIIGFLIAKIGQRFPWLLLIASSTGMVGYFASQGQELYVAGFFLAAWASPALALGSTSAVIWTKRRKSRDESRLAGLKPTPQKLS